MREIARGQAKKIRKQSSRRYTLPKTSAFPICRTKKESRFPLDRPTKKEGPGSSGNSPHCWGGKVRGAYFGFLPIKNEGEEWAKRGKGGEKIVFSEELDYGWAIHLVLAGGARTEPQKVLLRKDYVETHRLKL